MIECSEAGIKRFMKHVDVLPCGCWFWTGATSKGKGNGKPYGTFWVNRKVGRVRAHRFACEVIGGMGGAAQGTRPGSHLPVLPVRQPRVY